MNPGAKFNLLLIEDNPGDVNLLKIQLKDSSVRYELIIAENFFDGVDHCKNGSIDLVLLDLTLPDSTGFKTLSSFLDKFPNIPVIVLTGINNEIVGNQAIKAGAQDFLVKGQFDGKILGRSIRYSLQRFKTQLKLEETAKTLAIADKRYVEAQEMAHFGNWEMDIVSNEMKWTSEMYRIFGFHPNSISPTLSDYLSYVHMEDKTTVETFFDAAVKDGKAHKLEHRIVIEGRNIRHVVIQAKVNFEEINGKILLVGAIQDITERKVSEQLIIEKNLTQKASKIKEAALADIGFHIRTPLSSIINLTYLIENAQESGGINQYIDGLKTSVDDLSIMVNNLLNFSLLVAENIEVDEDQINILQFLSGIEKVLSLKCEHSKITLNTAYDKGLPQKIVSDGNKLTQIFINLFEFAVSGSKDSSKIELHVSSDLIPNSDKNLIKFNFTANTQELSGEQIKQLLNADHLLEKFDENPSNEEKKLMGFSIVSKLIKVLGGTIDITSRASTGTTYEFHLPVVSIHKRIGNIVGEKPDSPIKILLVEDHFLNQIATKKVLTTWSPHVTVDIAENGLVGVQKFKEHGYDLILMDLQMPVMGGIEATQKIRIDSDVPIIALTAHSSKQEAENCVKAGINDYLSKPFKPEDLHEKVMNILVSVLS